MLDLVFIIDTLTIKNGGKDYKCWQINISHKDVQITVASYLPISL